MKLRVGIAEDSDFFRELLRDVLEEEGDITVVIQARRGDEAVRAAEIHRVDLWTVDLKMPGMDGLEVIEQLMAKHPVPILVLTGQPSSQDGSLVFRAIQRGALELLEKQAVAGDQGGKALRDRIRRLAAVSVVRRAAPKRDPLPVATPAPSEPGSRVSPGSQEALAKAAAVLVAIGSSTGGPQALADILRGLPAQFPLPLAIVQHLPNGFAEPFSRFLQENTPLKVVLVKGTINAEPGKVYLAPDGQHLVAKSAGALGCAPGSPGQMHVPSVDVFFSSLAEHYGPRAMGVLLTGMGDDGAKGMLSMRKTGALTVVQDEATSVVYGMPRAAALNGAASMVLPVGQIAGALQRQAGRVGQDKAS